MNTMNTLKAKMAAKMKGGFFTGAGLGLGFLTTGLFAAAFSMNIFSPGDVISAAKINQNFAIAAPEGAIMAFYLPECPQGWTPADGTLGTPDLRGQFIRGRDDAGTGAAGVDPDGARAIGNAQLDAFQGHEHEIQGRTASGNTGMLPSGTGVGLQWLGVDTKYLGLMTDGINGTPRAATETRPTNVALTYCMRKN